MSGVVSSVQVLSVPSEPVERKAEAAKETLRPIVTEAEALKKSDYTEIAWGELQDAIAVAKDAISEGAREDILAAQERLEAAVAETRAAAEKETLSKLCDSYEGYNGSIYTAESWEAFEAALNAAKAAVFRKSLLFCIIFVFRIKLYS